MGCEESIVVSLLSHRRVYKVGNSVSKEEDIGKVLFGEYVKNKWELGEFREMGYEASQGLRGDGGVGDERRRLGAKKSGC